MAMLSADHRIRCVINGNADGGVVIDSNSCGDLGASMGDDEENKSSLGSDDQEWLQLSIGGEYSNVNSSNPVGRGNSSNNSDGYHLLGSGIPFLFQQQQQQQGGVIINVSSSSVPESMIPRPAMALASPPSYFQPDHFRVIQPPRRPHSGIWFKLQASQNQQKEACLPQISKSYLRIKDGRMTIRVVIKYLANKLRMENIESQIEIRCRGQKVAPGLSLQAVRDNIWRRPSSSSSSSSSSSNFITLLPNSSTSTHIMLLQYMHAISTCTTPPPPTN